MKQWGTPKGATFWHRLVDGDYETKRCNPGAIPDGTDWVQGQRPRTEEEKKHLSERNTGRVMTEEWRARMSAASKGKPKSEEHKAAMKAATAEFHRKRKAGEV